MQVKTQRKPRLEKIWKFYCQNKIFKTAANTFYKEVGKETIVVKKTPSNEEVGFNNQADWIKKMEDNNEIPEQE